MERFINRFVVKRRNLIVDDVDVKGLLIVLNENLSIWRQGVRVCKVKENTWHISLLATNDEWADITGIIKSKNFCRVSYERKGYYRI